MLKLTKSEAQAKVTLVLQKRNIAEPPKSAVKAFLDTSGSFQDEWDDGIIALLADRVLAVASRLDDDGILDMYHFNNNTYPLGTCDFSKIQDTDKHLKDMLRASNTPLWRGTEFSPIVTQIIADLYAGDGGSQVSNATPAPKKRGFFSSLFGGDEGEVSARQTSTAVPDSYRNKTPTLVYVLTDGDAQDKRNALTVFEKLLSQSVYVMFINVSAVSSAAKELADKYSNVGYVYFPKLSQIDDEELMNALLTDEFVQWRAKFPA